MLIFSYVRKFLLIFILSSSSLTYLVYAQATITEDHKLKQHSKKQLKKQFIIVIDPGHGGKDSGAIGGYGHAEKVISLQIAKILQRLIAKESNIKSFLTRHGDYFVSLEQRLNIAKHHQADLFLSIHADSFLDPNVRGASVNIIAKQAMKKEHYRWQQNHRHDTHKLFGIDLHRRKKNERAVLLGLSQVYTRNTSRAIANSIIHELQGVTDLHQRTVRTASLRLLKSPEMPSLLIETGFISNLKSEKLLTNYAYQLKLAYAILRGIKQHVANK